MSSYHSEHEPAATPATPLLDRGSFARVCFQQQAWAVPLRTPGARYSIVTQDIAPGAVGFIAVQAFPEGMGLVISLAAADGQRVKILCRTRHCRALSDGLYEIEAKLDAACADESDACEIPPAWRRLQPTRESQALEPTAFIPDVFE